MKLRPSARSVFLFVQIALMFSTLGQAAPLTRDDYSTLLKQATESLNDDYQQSWAFTETAVKPETTTVSRYDPRQKEDLRWTLVSVNDHTPSAGEIEEFLEQKATQRQEASKKDEDQDDDADQSMAAMIKPGSLSLIEETDDYWHFNFAPAAKEDGEAFAKAVVGTLKIAKNGRYLSTLYMHNTHTFKPQFGVKVKEFMTRLRFGPAVEQGPIVPLSVDFKIDAQAFLVKSINEETSIKFSDYQPVGGL